MATDSGYEFIHRVMPGRLPASKRQRKRDALQSRYEELKLVVPYPELLEIEDATCVDPVAYNLMKGRCGTVPVPRYWRSASKRMFPRTYHKPGYRVPRGVAGTGIPELRRMMREREAGMSLRERIREKLHPKLGRSLVNQQTLHDAFFLHEARPHISRHGEVFEPGTDWFTRGCSPGVMSSELMEALGIDDRSPPPWLFPMQKYGMPPSYPDAKIPGVNAPIPEGCSYGYQPRGWGEPLDGTAPVAAEDDGLQRAVETIYNDQNQYTRPVYTEDFEERVVAGSPEAGEEPPAPEPGANKSVEAPKKRRSRKEERLYKNIKF